MVVGKEGGRGKGEGGDDVKCSGDDSEFGCIM